ncbi:hypothetical protein ACVIGB_000734 [Bradyrhizobium sp. USDA 4341]
MTEREALCLQFLSEGRMEANARQIGQHVYANLFDRRGGGSNFAAIGAAICGRLRKRGLVMFLPDLAAWRITKAGREAQAELLNGKGA